MTIYQISLESGSCYDEIRRFHFNWKIVMVIIGWDLCLTCGSMEFSGRLSAFINTRTG